MKSEIRIGNVPALGTPLGQYPQDIARFMDFQFLVEVQTIAAL